jgi:hypothetical protein
VQCRSVRRRLLIVVGILALVWWILTRRNTAPPEPPARRTRPPEPRRPAASGPVASPEPQPEPRPEPADEAEAAERPAARAGRRGGSRRATRSPNPPTILRPSTASARRSPRCFARPATRRSTAWPHRTRPTFAAHSPMPGSGSHPRWRRGRHRRLSSPPSAGATLGRPTHSRYGHRFQSGSRPRRSPVRITRPGLPRVHPPWSAGRSTTFSSVAARPASLRPDADSVENPRREVLEEGVGGGDGLLVRPDRAIG